MPRLSGHRTSRQRAHFGERRHGIPRRHVLHGHVVAVTGLVNRFEYVAVIDLSRTWFMPSGHIAHMEVPDRLDIRAQQLN